MNQEKNIFEKAENIIQENNKRIKELEDTKYIQAELEDIKAFEAEIKKLQKANRTWKREVLAYKGAI